MREGVKGVVIWRCVIVKIMVEGREEAKIGFVKGEMCHGSDDWGGRGNKCGSCEGEVCCGYVGEGDRRSKSSSCEGGCVVVIIMEEWEVCCDCYDGEVREEAKNEVIKGGMCRGNDDDGGVGWS